MAISVAMLCCLAASSAAQRTWPEPGPAPLFGVEIGKGLYTPLVTPNGVVNFALPTYTLSGSAWFPLGRRFVLTAELPVSHVSERLAGAASDVTVIGDPWIGFEAAVGRDWTWEAGVRPGLVPVIEGAADSIARANGIAADYDHYEAWRPGLRSMRTSMHLDHQFTGGLFLGGLAGASVAWPTRRGTEDNDTDVYLLYGVRLGLRQDGVVTSLAFLGRAYTTANGPNTEPTVNQLAVNVGATSGRIRPLAELRVYRDRLLEPKTKAVLSVGVKVWR